MNQKRKMLLSLLGVLPAIMLLFSSTVMAQTLSISGKVTDKTLTNGHDLGSHTQSRLFSGEQTSPLQAK